MDITGILSGLGSILPLGSSTAQSKAHPTIAPDDPPQASVALNEQSEALQEILSRYDVTHISARDFSQLIQELKQAGAIATADYEELALLRLELDQEGIDPDETLDMVDLLQRKLQTQEKELSRLEEKQGRPLDRAQALESTLRQIDWISKFALIHTTGDYRPLNAVA